MMNLLASEKQNSQVNVRKKKGRSSQIPSPKKESSKDGGDPRRRRAEELEAGGGWRWSRDLPFQGLRSEKTEKSSSKQSKRQRSVG